MFLEAINFDSKWPWGYLGFLLVGICCQFALQELVTRSHNRKALMLLAGFNIASPLLYYYLFWASEFHGDVRFAGMTVDQWIIFTLLSSGWVFAYMGFIWDMKKYRVGASAVVACLIWCLLVPAAILFMQIFDFEQFYFSNINRISQQPDITFAKVNALRLEVNAALSLIRIFSIGGSLFLVFLILVSVYFHWLIAKAQKGHVPALESGNDEPA